MHLGVPIVLGLLSTANNLIRRNDKSEVKYAYLNPRFKEVGETTRKRRIVVQPWAGISCIGSKWAALACGQNAKQRSQTWHKAKGNKSNDGVELHASYKLSVLCIYCMLIIV